MTEPVYQLTYKEIYALYKSFRLLGFIPDLDEDTKVIIRRICEEVYRHQREVADPRD